MNLPNKLTIFRVLLVVLMLIVSVCSSLNQDIPIRELRYIINVKDLILLAIFIIASITDCLDGYFARKNNQITTFGKFLDPIADKILVLTALIILVAEGKIPAWIPCIIMIREFVVSGYRLVIVEKNGEVIAANMWGKIKTVSQIFAIGFCFVDMYKFGQFFTNVQGLLGIIINVITTTLMAVSVIATIISGAIYLKDWKKVILE